MNYNIHNLKMSYNMYSYYLINYQHHLNYCYMEHIITRANYHKCLNIINNLINQLNDIYNTNEEKLNDKKNKLSTNETTESVMLESECDNIKHCREFENTCKILNINIKYNYDHELFNEIKKTILTKIAGSMGFKNIHDGLSLIIGERYHKLYQNDKDFMKYFNLYNNIFVPLKYYIENINYDDDDETNTIDAIYVKKKYIDNNVIINSSGSIYIRWTTNRSNTLSGSTVCKYIVFDGYFKNDSINIIQKVSPACYPFIHDKILSIVDNVSKKKDINKEFTKKYIKYMNIGDIILSSKHEILNSITNDYKKYNELIDMMFVNIVNDINKYKKYNNTTIHKIYTIIKLLLFGNDENINTACVLYGIMKEKNVKGIYNLADVIYKNLCHELRSKIHKKLNSIAKTAKKIRLSSNNVNLEKQIIICKDMPDNVKMAALEKIEEMKTSNSDYYKQLLYVKTLLNYPWSSDDTYFTNIGKSNAKSIKFLDNVKTILNNNVYGHIKCKNAIIELLGKWIKNPMSQGSAISFVGPPGVGKTLFASTLGKAFNIPFIQITLGGQHDGADLHGHGYTYSSAQPGKIVTKMCSAGSARCIIYFDELDKTAKKNNSNEIHSILNHIIDEKTNKEFQDRFFQEIDFPLDKVLFIFSYNDSSLIDKTLLDRMDEIRIEPFTKMDKIIIAKKFIIPKICEILSFNKNYINIDDSIIEYIIDTYTDEAGIRKLKKKVERIFLKLNIDRIYKKYKKNRKINLTKKNIIEYLGKKTANIIHIHDSDMVGVINGLYTTTSGRGGILPIQIYHNYSNKKFSLKITGNQLKTMQESIYAAHTVAMDYVIENIRNIYTKQNPSGFHIHTPDGSTKKDGPSAGCANVVAFISRILNKKIKHDIAITGEIDLTGKVSKIGGLQYKLVGAKQAGVKYVYIPTENKDDLDEFREKYKDILNDQFNVIMIDNVMDVIKDVIIDFKLSDINPLYH